MKGCTGKMLGIILTSIGLWTGCEQAPQQTESTVSAAQVSPMFDDLYVLGDSMSDNGNLHAALWPFGLMGAFSKDNVNVDGESITLARMTNGKSLAEHLADGMGMVLLPSAKGGKNFAHTAATSSPETEGVIAAPALPEQVESLFEQLSDNGESLTDQDAVLIFMGSNDVLAATKINAKGDQKAEAEDIVKRAAVAIDAEVGKLIAQGAKTIFVLNSPNIGNSPQVATYNANDPGFVQREADALTQMFNQELANKMSQVKTANPAVKIVELDTYKKAADLYASFKELGFTTRTEPCYLPFPKLRYTPGCNADVAHQYYYFDDMHPSTQVYKLIADLLLPEIEDAMGQ